MTVTFSTGFPHVNKVTVTRNEPEGRVSSAAFKTFHFSVFAIIPGISKRQLVTVIKKLVINTVFSFVDTATYGVPWRVTTL